MFPSFSWVTKLSTDSFAFYVLLQPGIVCNQTLQSGYLTNSDSNYHQISYKLQSTEYIQKADIVQEYIDWIQ